MRCTGNQKSKNKIYKLGKVDDRIQIMQLTRDRNKRQKERFKVEEEIYFPIQKSHSYLWKTLHGSVIYIIHRHLVTISLYANTCKIYVYTHANV